jgi:hypothetical protein
VHGLKLKCGRFSKALAKGINAAIDDRVSLDLVGERPNFWLSVLDIAVNIPGRKAAALMLRNRTYRPNKFVRLDASAVLKPRQTQQSFLELWEIGQHRDPDSFYGRFSLKSTARRNSQKKVAVQRET